MCDSEGIYSVIVADDEGELRRALIQRVDWKGAGFFVIGEAENGADAVNLVESLRPDLLLADIRMPFVSGIEMARQVREIRPATQIAFLSGYDDFTYAQQAIQYNVLAYLLKPISAAEMFVELQKMKEKMEEQLRSFSLGTEHADKMEISEFLMPLILDGCAGDPSMNIQQLLWTEAIRLGLQKNEKEEIRYVVLITSIYTQEKENHTTPASVGAIDLTLRKYVKHASFYAFGRVVSLLIAAPGAFDRFLHILTQDIVQNVQRILNCDVVIGCSREVMALCDLHEAYLEAMNAIGYTK